MGTGSLKRHQVMQEEMEVNVTIRNQARLLAALVLFAGAASAAVPTAPTELRIDVYSNSTLEIFWNRSDDDSQVVGYELIRNGQSIWLGDVTSYLDSNISANSTYSYNLVAIDDEQNRSPWSGTLSFSNQAGNTSSCSGTNSCTSTSVSIAAPNSGGSNSVHRPAGLRGDVYSESALELFWEQPSTPHVVGYDVFRDGGLSGRANGTSYFDSGLSGGTSYNYSVYTVTDSGLRSADSAQLTIKTAGMSATSAGNSSSSSASYSNNDGSGLSGTVSGKAYSPSAAEVFWEISSSNPVSLFEVKRNGAIVRQLDARSFFDESLVPDREYTYEIVAIDGARRYSLGNITLRTPSRW